MEELHVDDVPDAEREEVRKTFAGQGFDGEILDGVITDERKRRAALTTFVAFVLAGLVPVLPLCMGEWLGESQTFVASAMLAASGKTVAFGMPLNKEAVVTHVLNPSPRTESDGVRSSALR